jgi:serpin B
MRETMEPRKVAVTFPKFRVEKKYMMAGDLAKMGMPSAFNPRAADFSGMDGSRDLMISAVVHQTFVDVTEAGTEAAAATAAVIGVKAVLSEPKEEIKEFKADHPFIFLIQERTSGAILFLGRMSDPGQLR